MVMASNHKRFATGTKGVGIACASVPILTSSCVIEADDTVTVR